jgi:uncharacterized protein YjbJ (UPF0337 family)
MSRSVENLALQLCGPEGGTMSTGDKLRHKAEEAKGRAKEALGDLKDDPQMQAEGRGERIAAEAKQVGDRAKDAARDAADDVKDAVERKSGR